MFTPKSSTPTTATSTIKHKPLLMSSRDNLLLAITDIDKARNICAKSDTQRNHIATESFANKYDKRCQQEFHDNRNNPSISSSTFARSLLSSLSAAAKVTETKTRAHKTEESVRLKSTVSTNHLVNSLMTLLYFVAFVSLFSTYRVYVSAIGEYHTLNNNFA